MSIIQLVVKKETALKLNDCVKEYRRHHPEFDGIHISRNKIILELIKYYLQN